MAQQQPQRPTLGQKWNSFRANTTQQENKKHKKSHPRKGSPSAKEKSDSQRHTRSVDRPRPQRRNSFVRVDRANTITSNDTGGLIITSTSTHTRSHHCHDYEEEEPRKPKSMSSLILSKSSHGKKKKKKKKSKSPTTTSRGGIVVSSSSHTTKSKHRRTYDDDEDVAPRKPKSMPSLLGPKNSFNKGKKKGKKPKHTTTTTTTSKTSTIHPHLLHEEPKSGQSSRGKDRRQMLKESLSFLAMPEPSPRKESADEPRSSLLRSKSFRTLSSSIRNLFADDNNNNSQRSSSRSPPKKMPSFRRVSRSKQKAKEEELKKQQRRQQAPARRQMIIRLQ